MHKVILLDLQTRHAPSYVTKRNLNLWVITCFISDCMIMTASGLQRARAGDCFIKSPEFYEYHYTPEGAPQGFCCDWMHIQSDTMEQQLQELELPVNELLHLGNPHILHSALLKIRDEKSKLLPFSASKCSAIIDDLLITLARTNYNLLHSEFHLHEDQLTALRMQMQDHLEDKWNISKMADLVGFSSSRFSILYKKRFLRSPNDDLIEMRLERAKYLLISTNDSLKNIAQSCGFQNEFYFSRIFKEKTGSTPGIYRSEYFLTNPN